MPLFSRRPKKNEETAPAVESAAPDVPEAPDVSDVPDVPEVPIAVTTYGAPAAPAHPRPTVRGIEDNGLLIEALARLDPKPTPAQTLEVARQLLQGRVYLRVRGQAQDLLAAGQELPMAIVTIGDARYALAFSGGAALQAAVRADGDTSTSAIAVAVPPLLHQVVDTDLAGIVVDHASAPAAAVLPRALLEKVLADLDESLAVKSALTGQRTPQRVAALVDALQTAPVWIAAKRDDDGRVGVSQTRMPDGTRMLEVFSHPLEVHVLGRGDQAVRITAAQIAAALVGEPELGGIVVNPQGPWQRLGRDDLAPLIARA
ncbi:MAG: SseB family protein [Microbacterium sp.]|uniref:SseB family protein n=1 Tax=Microbacterium sp. TaxID=51671 RepID=UPI0039E4C059